MSEMPCMPESIEVPGHAQPFVHDDPTGRSLHFSMDAMQSLMSCQRPFDLALPYTKTMMAFLLAKPRPAHILMIGLGGGSLAKFCYQNFPQTRITVVEINPHVIAMRQQFLIPDDDERLQVVCADGADFVRDAQPGFDVILVDGFDARGLSLQLCTPAFYENCWRIMTPSSVLVVNLDNENPAHPVVVDRINQTFEGNFVEINVLDRNNSIAFANKGIPISSHGMSLSWSLGHHALEARSQLQSELQRILQILDSRQPLGQVTCEVP
ncbi:MAG: fused MFS/spermidine synthase [Rhodoferax sp.]|nr:fused MFS/spermidine synthase [Rhodoferax sp.]